MRIKGKSIRSLAKILPMINDGRRFYVGIPIQGNEARLMEIGFSHQIEPGLSILPAAIGKCSRFNACGKEIIRHDLPLVPESRMVYSTWNDWHGYPHSGLQHRTFQVRQRDLITPPEEHINIAKNTDGCFAVSRELSVGKNSEEELLHVINLFLELFGQCHLMDENTIPLLKLKRLNWHVLPKGEYPWEIAKNYIERVTTGLKEGDREVVEYRIKCITKYSPDFLAIGQGGFNGYFVFGFSDKDLYVLESPQLDNATYVFASNWKELSQLTKKEILRENFHYRRIIHNRAWGRVLVSTLTGK